MPLFGIVFGGLRKLLFQNSLSPPNTIPESGMTGFWNLALQLYLLEYVLSGRKHLRHTGDTLGGGLAAAPRPQRTDRQTEHRQRVGSAYAALA